MVEIINNYESIVIFDNSLEEEALNALVEKFKSLIEANGTVESVDVWGKRRLAYPINDLTEGYYVLYNFSAKPTFPKEFERVLGITEGVMRHIVIRKED